MTSKCAESIAVNAERAREAIERSDFATANAILCATLDTILAIRSETVAGEALAALPITAGSVGVVRTESGLKARPRGGSPNRAQCDALMNEITLFVDSLPEQNLVERLEVMARCQAQRCMSSAAKLPAKRRRLRVLTWIRMWLLQRQKRSGKILQQQRFLLACLLHEPDWRIQLLWRQHAFWFHFNYAKRLLHLDNRAESSGYLSEFEWPERNDYRRLIRNSNTSRVLLSIHMGDFFGAFRVISSLADPGRQVISLRRDVTTNHGMQHFSADRMNHQVFYHQQYQAATIVSALRRGHHTLATLFDLREDFGSTVVVDFFGHPARFVKGPAQLAILGRSPILPFVCYETRGRNRIEMAPVIDTHLQPGESLQLATVRITQSLVSLAEGWIQRWPSQWKYLTTLPAYFETES